MRANPEILDLEAGHALVGACHQLDLPIERTSVPGVFEARVNGRRVRFAVHGATLVDAARVGTIIDRPTPRRAVPLLVGDRILGPARPLLDAAGWSWLDRRGRLHVNAPGVLIDVEVEPDLRPSPRRHPTASLDAAGVQEVAAALLLAPDDPPGVREIARSSGFAPSTISRSLTELRVGGLVRRDGRPVIPDLFWALAEHWRPEWVALASPVSPMDPRLTESNANLNDLERGGFAVGDTRAALAWRAPVVASADVAPMLYVPDRAARDRVIETWGRASGRAATTAGRVAVAPVHALAAHRFRRPGEPWPVVHPLFVALDLATDRSRGHQILDEWNPEDTPRVW